MTYEPYEKGGSKLTVSNPARDWTYVTIFDGAFRPVTGPPGGKPLSEIINAKSIRNSNKKDGVVYQVVIKYLVGRQQHDQQ